MSTIGIRITDGDDEVERAAFRTIEAAIEWLQVQAGDTSEPRTWSIPPMPEHGAQVTDHDAQTWTRNGGLWFLDGGSHAYDWPSLLAKRGPLTEVVETEVEAAARRLREHGWRGDAVSIEYPGHLNDAVRVARHVLNGGTL